MDQKTIDHFRQHYMQVPEEELESLDARKQSLVDEAQVALEQVLSQRSVSVEKIRYDNTVEDEDRAELARAEVTRKEVRDTKLLKWLAIISVPLILLSAILRPDSFKQTLLSSIVQALFFFAILWIVLFIKRKLNKKEATSPEDNS